jgi:hypothetical protein
MPIDEVRANINSRRDKIFLLMEELRRLRIQQRLKVRGRGAGGAVAAAVARRSRCVRCLARLEKRLQLCATARAPPAPA